MIRLNFRSKRPEALPNGFTIPFGGKNSNYQTRQLFDQLSKLSTEIIQLRQTLQKKTKLIQQLKDLLARYETFFMEEVTFFQTQQAKIALINQTYKQIENFIKDVDNQISNLSAEISEDSLTSSTIPLKRILSRFLRQKDFYQRQAQEQFENLDQVISERRKRVETLRDEIESITGQIKEIAI